MSGNDGQDVYVAMPQHTPEQRAGMAKTKVGLAKNRLASKIFSIFPPISRNMGLQDEATTRLMSCSIKTLTRVYDNLQQFDGSYLFFGDAPEKAEDPKGYEYYVKGFEDGCLTLGHHIARVANAPATKNSGNMATVIEAGEKEKVFKYASLFGIMPFIWPNPEDVGDIMKFILEEMRKINRDMRQRNPRLYQSILARIAANFFVLCYDYCAFSSAPYSAPMVIKYERGKYVFTGAKYHDMMVGFPSRYMIFRADINPNTLESGSIDESLETVFGADETAAGDNGGEAKSPGSGNSSNSYDSEIIDTTLRLAVGEGRPAEETAASHKKVDVQPHGSGNSSNSSDSEIIDTALRSAVGEGRPAEETAASHKKVDVQPRGSGNSSSSSEIDTTHTFRPLTAGGGSVGVGSPTDGTLSTSLNNGSSSSEIDTIHTFRPLTAGGGSVGAGNPTDGTLSTSLNNGSSSSEIDTIHTFRPLTAGGGSVGAGSPAGDTLSTAPNNNNHSDTNAEGVASGKAVSIDSAEGQPTRDITYAPNSKAPVTATHVELPRPQPAGAGRANVVGVLKDLLSQRVSNNRVEKNIAEKGNVRAAEVSPGKSPTPTKIPTDLKRSDRQTEFTQHGDNRNTSAPGQPTVSALPTGHVPQLEQIPWAKFFNLKSKDLIFPMISSFAKPEMILGTKKGGVSDGGGVYAVKEQMGDRHKDYTANICEAFKERYTVGAILGTGSFGMAFEADATKDVTYGATTVHSTRQFVIKTMRASGNAIRQGLGDNAFGRYKLCKDSDSEIFTQFFVSSLVRRDASVQGTQTPIVVNVVRIYDWFTLQAFNLRRDLLNMGINENLVMSRTSPDGQGFSKYIYGVFSGTTKVARDSMSAKMPFYVTVMERCDSSVEKTYFETPADAISFFRDGYIGNMLVQVLCTTNSLYHSIGLVHGDMKLANILLLKVGKDFPYDTIHYSVVHAPQENAPGGSGRPDTLSDVHRVDYYAQVGGVMPLYKISDFSLSSFSVKVGPHDAVGAPPTADQVTDVPAMLTVSAGQYMHSTALDVHRLGADIFRLVFEKLGYDTYKEAEDVGARLSKSFREIMGGWILVVRDMLITTWSHSSFSSNSDKRNAQKCQYFFDLVFLMLTAIDSNEKTIHIDDTYVWYESENMSLKRLGSMCKTGDIGIWQAVQIIGELQRDRGASVYLSYPINQTVGTLPEKLLLNKKFSEFVRKPPAGKAILRANAFLSDAARTWFDDPHSFVPASAKRSSGR